MMESIFLIDKPSGITSFDVIRQLRTRLKVRKMGHAGTLDPLATGLLIIAVGDSTKKLNVYLKLPKVYRAAILLGERRDTGDMAGAVLESKSVGELSNGDIAKAMSSLIGELELPVPAYSAVKVRGRALYKRARSGEEFETPVKTMRVLKAVLEDVERQGDKVLIRVEFEVGSGTYIRSLAEELGRRLGYPATLYTLRRTRIGEFRVEHAKKIGDF